MKVLGKWAYLYRALDKHRNTIDFYLSPARNAKAAKRFLGKVLLGANRREPGFRATNGELVTVSRITDSGRIELEDGRTLPADYRQIDHGYAVTAHRSQGKSVDRVVISADSMKRELFYVAASRGRESLTIVTSDVEQLRNSIASSGTRQSASELARKSTLELAEDRREGLHAGLARGLDAARNLAHHHAQHLPYQEAAEITKAPVLEQAVTPELKPEVPQQEITRELGDRLGL